MSLVPALLATSAGQGALYGVIGFLLWVVVLVWIYNIARRKGRHALGWVLLGFFFWVLALIVVLLLPSKRTTDSYRGG